MIAAIPFVLQGIVMSIDEFICHRRREMRRWERLGHPLDTIFFISCLAWILLNLPAPTALIAYGVLCVGNCLFITKDEWQHRELCTGFENWLHAILFLLHPVVLATAGWLWWSENPLFQSIVGVTAGLAALFAFYQTFYWNLWRRDQ